MYINKKSYEDFKKLPFSKKCWKLSIVYLDKCSINKPFVNGKPSKSFFAVRNFWLKQSISDLNLIWLYLSSFDDERILSLTQVFNNSKRLSDKLFMKLNQNTKLDDYKRVGVREWLQSPFGEVSQSHMEN